MCVPTDIPNMAWCQTEIVIPGAGATWGGFVLTYLVLSAACWLLLLLGGAHD